MDNISKLDHYATGDITIDNIAIQTSKTNEKVAEVNEKLDSLENNFNSLKILFNNGMRTFSNIEPSIRKDGAAWFILS